MNSQNETAFQVYNPQATGPGRLIREREVRARLGNIPRSTLYKMIADRLLPPAIHLAGGRNAFWLENEIDARLAGLIAESRRGQQ